MYSVFTPENKEREAEKCKEVRTAVLQIQIF